MRALSPDEVIDRLREAGYTDDEIVEEVSRMHAVERRPDHLEWARGQGGSLHQIRLLREWLADVASAPREDLAPAAAVKAERARRIAAHEPHGYDALARHFKVDPSTIRRRLDVL